MSLCHPTTFESLTVRYRYTADLVTETGLRIGAGKQTNAAATDQPVLRDALGRPYIPGSSLKGSLRSAMEAILRGLDRKDLWACDLFENPCLGTPGNTDNASDQPDLTLKDITQKICTTCSLFGSPLLAGRVYVHDLEHLSGGPTEIRDGVGIDRDLGTARGGIKYDTEVVPTGSRFALEITLENVDSVRLALVLQALEWLANGQVLLGGLTTRGLGRVSLAGISLTKTTPDALLDPPGETGDPYAVVPEKEKQGAFQSLHQLIRGTGDPSCT